MLTRRRETLELKGGGAGLRSRPKRWWNVVVLDQVKACAEGSRGNAGGGGEVRGLVRKGDIYDCLK